MTPQCPQTTRLPRPALNPPESLKSPMNLARASFSFGNHVFGLPGVSITRQVTDIIKSTNIRKNFKSLRNSRYCLLKNNGDDISWDSPFKGTVVGNNWSHTLAWSTRYMIRTSDVFLKLFRGSNLICFAAVNENIPPVKIIYQRFPANRW